MTDTANAWTEERLQKLRELWDEGLSITQIGDALGVSRNAIAGKAHRMGLPKRPSPISKTSSETKKASKAQANRRARQSSASSGTAPAAMVTQQMLLANR